MDRFLHYRVSRSLGQGNDESTFIAVDEGLQRAVVLKVLDQEHMRSSQWQNDFRTEMKRQRAMDDPRIGLVYSLEENDGKLVLVREYVEGESLAELLQNGPIDYALALNLTEKIASAVKRLHDEGMTHRNLSLGNVIIDERNQVHLVDAGLESVIDRPPEPETDIPLPDEHLSPEEADDLHAIGKIFFNLLTGESPFGRSEVDTGSFDPMQTVDFAPYSQRRVPGVARLLIGKLLARDRSEQILSAEQLVQTLREMATIGIEPEWEPARKKWSPNARQYMLISILALLLIILWLVVTMPR